MKIHTQNIGLSTANFLCQHYKGPSIIPAEKILDWGSIVAPALESRQKIPFLPPLLSDVYEAISNFFSQFFDVYR
jgi:hypothetical protein